MPLVEGSTVSRNIETSFWQHDTKHDIRHKSQSETSCLTVCFTARATQLVRHIVCGTYRDLLNAPGIIRSLIQYDNIVLPDLEEYAYFSVQSIPGVQYYHITTCVPLKWNRLPFQNNSLCPVSKNAPSMYHLRRGFKHCNKVFFGIPCEDHSGCPPYPCACGKRLPEVGSTFAGERRIFRRMTGPAPIVVSLIDSYR